MWDLGERREYGGPMLVPRSKCRVYAMATTEETTPTPALESRELALASSRADQDMGRRPAVKKCGRAP